jgi:cytochrome c biogenesis protein CcmG/thiol:disulfide interchange protein DsbE
VKVARIAACAGVAALAVVLVVRLVGQRATAATGAVAPSFRLPVLAPARMRSLSLERLRGRPVVVNFWASWCDPCRREAPLLAAAARADRGRVAFVGVNVHDFRSSARAFLRRHPFPYVAVASSGDRLVSAYGLTNLPETFYVDASGRIVARTVGQLSRAALRRGIAAAERG